MAKSKSLKNIKLDITAIKKPAEASNLFHNIMKASVKQKPKNDLTKPMQILNHINEEIAMVVPDYGKYLIMQINGTTNGIFYNIDENCPIEKHQKIEKVILENVKLIGIPVTTEDIE